MIPWRSGRPLAWDITSCDTFAPTYLSLAASGAGKVANQAESRKRARRDIESTQNFIPIAIETSGVFGEHAQEVFKCLGHRLRNHVSRPFFEHFDSTNQYVYSEV